MSFEYWYMLPVAVAVATTAMASGVGGATFFAPILILALRFPPEVAIGTGLITEVFGFASGLSAYVRRRLIDFRLGLQLVMLAVPAALIGAWLANRIEPSILKAILGMGLIALGLSFLRVPEREDVDLLDAAIEDQHGGGKGSSCVVTRDGESICYTVCNRFEGGVVSAVGGLFMGMISAGLGELNSYYLLQRCRVPSRVSVATSVFAVAVTALSAASGHLVQFLRAGPEVVDQVLSIVVFTVPGVLLGGQLGPIIASRIPQRLLERALGVLFLLVGGVMVLANAF
ncbi:MAG: sulfite exporter TauE/SafE family protein [Acidobacteria bacterium]|nr:MAG: sulfite exporter TauE/SafE family protein [Acidobacteriota bacterium]